MRVEKFKKIYNALLVFAFFYLIILFIIYKNPDFKIDIMTILEYKNLMIKAYIITIEISLISLILSIFFGIILFLMSISKKLYLNYFFAVYTQISLGIPLLVHVVVLYFFLASALGINNPILAGTLILSCYMASYFAKTFQGAYNSLDNQQFKIMHILQLPKKTIVLRIIAPQIIENTLPTLTSHFSLLIKSTALLSLISVPEFTNFINMFNSKTFEFVTGYLLLAVGYLLITIPLSYIAKYLSEKVGFN